MSMMDLTPTQRMSNEKSRAFHAKIAARAVPQKEPAERAFSIKGYHVFSPKPAETIQAREPQRLAVEPDPAVISSPCEPRVEAIVWPVIPEQKPDANPEGPQRRILIAEIIRQVSKFYNEPESILISHRRTGHVAYARQVAMYLAKELTPHSLPQIGRRFGDRDHTTVLHGCRKIKGNMLKDENLAHEIAVLIEIITGRQQ